MSAHDHPDLRVFARDNCPEAFERLVAAYGGMVYGVCRRQLRSAAAAEDATQETFLKLIRNAGTIRSNVAAWLHACAVSTARDVARREATRRRHEQAAGQLPTEEATAPALLERLDTAMQQLAESDRTLICERYFAGRTQRELAETLGISQSLVSRRLRQALNRLRGELAVTAGGISLLVTLRAEGAVALPSSLQPSLIKLALAVPKTTTLTTGVLLMSAKAKLTTVAAITLLLLGSISWYVTRPDPTPVVPYAEHYRLAVGENLKLIEPPYSAERNERERTIWQAWADETHETAPESHVVPLTDEDLRNRSVLNVQAPDGTVRRDSAVRLGETEHSRQAWFTQRAALFDIQWWELSDHNAPDRSAEASHLAPPDLPRLFGDWVVREDSTTEQRLADYASTLGERMGTTVAFQRRDYMRMCVVWSGPTPENPTPTDSPWPWTDRVLYVTPTPPNYTEDGTLMFATGIGITPTDSLETWGIALDMPVMVEGATLPPEITIVSDALVGPDNPRQSEIVEQTLVQLEAQTGGDWRIEPRTVQVWTPIVGDEVTFHEQYQLADGENLKHIEPPYTGERNRHKQAALSGPYVDTMPIEVIRDAVSVQEQLQDGWIVNVIANMSWDDGWPDRDWATSTKPKIFGTEWFRIGEHPDLPPIRGDWVFRDESTTQERVADYARILTAKYNRPVRFVRQPVQRTCIVWTRRGELSDEVLLPDTDIVELFATALPGLDDPERRRELRQSREHMWSAGGDIQRWPATVDLPLIVDGEAPKFVSWTILRDAVAYSADDAGLSERLPAILANLEAQTGDRWTLEQRTLDVWVPVVLE